MRNLITAIAVAALGAVASGQEVNFRGKIEDVRGTDRFLLDCTDAEVFSGVFNLNQFVGEQVRGRGVWNGSIAAPTIDIHELELAAETFGIGGGGQIGDEASFEAKGVPGDFAVLFASLETSFLPTLAKGVLFLDPTILLSLGAGTIRGDGEFEIKVQIPDDPALEGLDVFGQALQSTAGSGVFWSNIDCVTLEA